MSDNVIIIICIGILIGIAAIFACGLLGVATTHRKIPLINRLIAERYGESEHFISEDGLTFQSVTICFEKKVIAFGHPLDVLGNDDYKFREYRFDQLLEVKLNHEESLQTRTKRTGFARAQSQSETRFRKLSIRFLFDDARNPIEDFVLFTSSTLRDPLMEGILVKRDLERLDRLHALATIAMRRA